MDRTTAHRPPQERPLDHHHHPPPSSYQTAYPPPTAQPPMQIPFSDPFHTTRDPFLPGSHARRGSFSMGGRAWPPTPPQQGNGASNTKPPPPPPLQNHSLPPQPPHHPSNGTGHMSLPFEPSRRRSLGASPPQYAQASHDQHPPPQPSFGSRNMPPPPSPPQQMPPPIASSLHAGAPRGPPTSSPFAGLRDLTGFTSHRPAMSMSISSMLGSGDERKVNGSPHSSAALPSAGQRPMQPPSPGRARSSSMRDTARREPSPHRSAYVGEPRAASAFLDRGVSEPRKDGIFGSPQFQRDSAHSFRNFQPLQQQQDQRGHLNSTASLGRPSSQPVEPVGPRSVDEIVRREPPKDARLGPFRHFGEPHGPPPPLRQETNMLYHNNGVTSQPRESDVFGSPHMERDGRHGMIRSYQPGPFGTSMREDQAGLFRPTFPHAPDIARESIESRRELARSSPPSSELHSFERGQNGFADRPMTFEEHQRMEAMHREQHQRKESDGSVHRAVLNISPELGRKGRNTPQPQAVQGAQPRSVGPGGDNPRLAAFGRIFSGLGSGVGSATPTPGILNGTDSPSRMSPSRYMEDGDMPRYQTEQDRADAKAGSGAGKKDGRRPRDDPFKAEEDGVGTPDLQRGNKRAKTTHHHHHYAHAHHHHHHEPNEPQPGSFNTLKFSSNSSVPPSSNPAHHHHHHTAHPSHQHHHHAPARPIPAPRKPITTVHSERLLEQALNKPRKHLGSQLYTTEVFLPSAAETPLDGKIRFQSKSKPIPLLQDKENCTFTVRVPRWYLASSDESDKNKEPSSLEEICKHRQVWGSDVYTDDSDVIAAAVHSGWLKGDFGELNADLHNLFHPEDEPDNTGIPTALALKPAKPVRAPSNHDLHITLLILPPLENYVSTMQNHIRSREWGKIHDGMSYMIHRVEFVDESPGNRYVERGAEGRKARLKAEEAKRKEAAAGLLMFALQAEGTVGMGKEMQVGGGVRVGA